MNDGVTLYLGDCLDIMKTLPDGSVDAVVTDPPYGLAFMGKDWDRGVPGVRFWAEALRVSKPGAHLLAFGGTRTWHRLACAIEDAGWEIRDTLMWIYGSGFPKSLDVSKAIDKAAGAGREANKRISITAPATPDAMRWQGWGTALKPAWEPIIVARKALIGTAAANVLEYGTGAINIDGCRVGTSKEVPASGTSANSIRVYNGGFPPRRADVDSGFNPNIGRWPANLLHDGSDEVLACFPNNTQRFFYCAKASMADRDEGLEACRPPTRDTWGAGIGHASGDDLQRRNNHPTVKPTALMRYLVRLVTPPGGMVLDPFMGSGSTGKAAVLEGFGFLGIEIDPTYYAIAEKRITEARAQLALPLAEAGT